MPYWMEWFRVCRLDNFCILRRPARPCFPCPPSSAQERPMRTDYFDFASKAATKRAGSDAGRRGSTLIFLTVALPFMIIPLVGLAVDATMLYIVQAKLAVAVDGAALGAGRLLGTPANPTEIAGEFLKANFPDHYWGAYNLKPDISITTSFST